MSSQEKITFPAEASGVLFKYIISFFLSSRSTDAVHYSQVFAIQTTCLY
jgi:hypothetical protein